MTDVVMPQMGESITEGTLTKWLKKLGDPVERDEPLFEISTDKVDTEIPAPAAGRLKEVLVAEGQTVAVDTVVARIEETVQAGVKQPPRAEAPPAEPAPAAAEAQPAPAAPAEPAAEPAPKAAVKGPVSPLVRRMAREHRIDLSEIQGSGAGGRITRRDVEAYLASRVAAAAAPAPPPAAPPPPSSEPIVKQQPAPSAKTRVEPMSTMRRKIAEHMVLSKRTSPHVTTVHRADLTAIARLRDSLKGPFKERYGFSLTYLPFVVRASAQALREFPAVNASVEGTSIVYHNEINIGIAVALEDGLIVPVIRNADSLSIVGLQRAIADLAGRARSRRLTPDEVQASTFSITNFGGFGSLFATPVINQPNVAILGVGAVTKEPVVIHDAIAIRTMVYLSLTFDHRLIDGARADQFTARVKQILENWSEPVL